MTLVIGVACLYGALFVLGLVGARLAVARDVLSQGIGHPADLATYLRITWMASSLATVAGALGAGLESDAAVREAAYGYRPEHTTERKRQASLGGWRCRRPGRHGRPERSTTRGERFDPRVVAVVDIA